MKEVRIFAVQRDIKYLSSLAFSLSLRSAEILDQ
jgi:hypothetical protein